MNLTLVRVPNKSQKHAFKKEEESSLYFCVLMITFDAVWDTSLWFSKERKPKSAPHWECFLSFSIQVKFYLIKKKIKKQT